MSWVIVKTSESVGYDSEESATYDTEVNGVIGPFTTEELAKQYDFAHFDRYNMTDIFELETP